MLLLVSAFYIVINNSHADSVNTVDFSADQRLVALQQELFTANQDLALLSVKLQHVELRRQQQLLTGRRVVVTEQMLKRSELELAHAQSELANFTQMLKNINYNYLETKQRIEQLTEELRKARLSVGAAKQLPQRDEMYLVNKLGFNREMLGVQAQLKEVLEKVQALASQISQVDQEWLEHLQILYNEQQDQQRILEQQQQQEVTRKQQQQVLLRLTQLKQKLQVFIEQDRIADPQAIQLDAEIFLLERQSDLNHIELQLTYLERDLNSLIVQQEPSVSLLSEVKHRASVINEGLLNLEGTIHTKFKSVDERRQFNEDAYKQQLLTKEQFTNYQLELSKLTEQFASQIVKVQDLKQQLTFRSKIIEEALNDALSKRQTLPGFDWQGWRALGQKFAHVPTVTLQSVKLLLTTLTHNLQQMSIQQYVILGLLQIVWLALWVLGHRGAKLLLERLSEHRQFVIFNILYVSLQLLRRNFAGLFLLIFAWTTLVIAGVNFAVYRLFLYLTLVWFGFRIVTGLARLSLVETLSDASGRDVLLYQRLQFSFSLIGLVMALTVIVYQLPIAYEVRDLVNRIFLLLVLVVAIILWRGRNVVPSLMRSYLGRRHIYVVKTVNVLSFFIPIVIFSDALIGLIGYIDLARTLGYYQILFVLFIAGYVLARGLWGDLMDFLSALIIRYLANGWLISEAVLKPVDQVMRIVLFLLMGTLLFISYGWGPDSIIVKQLVDILNYSLFSVAGSNISVFNLIELAILLAVLFWAGRWSREFAYRWVFLKVRDSGLRNSLAIFFQYIVVIVGIVITLNVLGIGLTGLTVVLGGLAVGLGFGLRDLANNFVSGVLLLIERPVQVGDFISIDNFEGEIIHIGMRSMTVKTFDNMEVLVPNADTFSRAFTNWTRRDNVIRTVASVKIGPHDNPHQVQQLILSVLRTIPDIVADPPPQVFLKEIAEVLIEFQVSYFINIKEVGSRAKIKSKVLLAIWNSFKQHQIRPPYPQQEINITALPKADPA
ncbi:MAG: mechanosensitive ion channel [Gammaproteobacteria bacterium]